MPYWRGIFVVALGLSTSGCLFSAYQIASLTASGVSYVFSGRGMGDHALSIALDKDCATLRLLEGEEVCVDYAPEYESSWAAMAATWQAPDLDGDGTEAPVDGDGTVTLVAEADIADIGIAGLETSPVLADAAFNLVPASVSRAQDLKTVQLVKPVAVEFSVGDSILLADGGQEKLSAPALDFDALIPETGRKTERSMVSVVRTPRALPVAPSPVSDDAPVAVAPVVASAAAAGPRVFLVLGSFRDSANARKLVARHSAMNMAVMTLTSRGRDMYRVVAGPVGDGELDRIRGRLVKAGIRNTWAVRLCQGNLAVPPCHEPAVQQAQLPSESRAD